MKKAVILDRAKRKTAKGLPLTEEEKQALLEHDKRREYRRDYIREYMRIYRNPQKINTIKIDRNTPLVMLTLGDLLDAIKGQDIPNTKSPVPGKRYIYGLRGIQGLFNVSHATAQKYKDGILKDAVYQSGRTIVVDADKAIELFNTRNEKEL